MIDATYRFHFDETYVLECVLRQRKQVWWRRPFYVAKAAIGIVTILLMVLCFIVGLRALDP